MNLTLDLSRKAIDIDFASLEDDVRETARLCLLDWIGVAIAGASEPLTGILIEEFADASDEAILLGGGRRARSLDAALINGASSHALDYDDYHLAIIGHPSVAMYPALFALAESRRASMEDLLTAFVAGYETACRVGLVVAPSHYAGGYHATGTVGALGAAAGCAKLMGLDCDLVASAIGIAATQAGGLKAMFGTMCKPLHAGRASYNGLFAARAAAAGFSSRSDIVECEQGFAEVLSRDFSPERGLAEPKRGWHIRNNVFKYHASCGGTHSAIEAATQLRDRHKLEAGDVEQITIVMDSRVDRICNIAEPATGLEAKFSLRQTVALAMHGHSTADPAVFSDELSQDPGIGAFRKRIKVEFVEPAGPLVNLGARVVIATTDGRSMDLSLDASSPPTDLGMLRQRLIGKFVQLTRREFGDAAQGVANSILTASDTVALVETLTGSRYQDKAVQ